MIRHHIEQTLDFINSKKIYPDIYTIEGASTNPKAKVNGKDVLIFCSNNYLGLAIDPRIQSKIISAAKIYGMGSGGSRLVSGNISVQAELENEIAKFKGAEDAITFTTGYMANTGIIPALMNPPKLSVFDYLKSQSFFGPKSVIFSDELNHASIVDGCVLAKTKKIVYRHRDLKDLERQLHYNNRAKNKLIITDGVFSMDGDIAPLDDIMELADAYNASVMVDDAHATGILGETGKGTAEHFQLEEYPDVTMGTFTKVFGGIGGFVVGPKDLIDYLRVTSRTYIFSAPIPPAIADGLIEAVKIVANEPERRIKLWENVLYFKKLLKEGGFNTLESETQIIPIHIGDEQKGVAVSRKLFDMGYFTPCIRWPAVSKNSSRLRLTLMTAHTKEQIDSLYAALLEVKKEFAF